ncbi:unnamed protein product [Hyaloperonospora brassicae]|uniref:Nucleotide-diphospho-sugar transferase domain-containing protein n=1 Tax=Hyaloperonospora brassicae TaxID=162125 RepID=A0AAV0SW60_HYABA|nr:unnamed protein product [Hyaloperonospora brassicae]
MKDATKRYSLRALSIGLLLLLGLVAAYFNLKLAWNTQTLASATATAFHWTEPLAPFNATGGVDGKKMQFIKTLYDIGQNTSQPRGIVIPVYEKIVKIAASLILELRTMGVDEPIELPYCGDVSIEAQTLLLQKTALGDIRFYDVCDLAAAATADNGPDGPEKVFCPNVTACHTKFRNFDIKVVAVVFSQFEELMLVDADTAFFVKPTVLWDSAKYKATGTLFMNDRHAHEIFFMAERMRGNSRLSRQHEFMANFDPVPFRFIPTLERAKATLPNPVPLTPKYEPSDYLFTSHSWNLRTGHQMDSSLLFWNKKKQPRATAILASFKALCDVGSPPSYGDKEMYFYAAELAETQYSFSAYTISGVGTDYQDHGEGKSTLCGDMAQLFPIEQDHIEDVPLFYLNSDRVLRFKPAEQGVYYVKARPADVYLGPFPTKRIECPFNITGAKFSEAETKRLSGRQRLHELVLSWGRIAQPGQSDVILESLDAAVDSMVAEQMETMRREYRRVKVPKL